MTELRNIPYFTNYLISKEGEIFCARTKEKLPSFHKEKGRNQRVRLLKDGQITKFYYSIPQLLKLAFPEMFVIIPSEITIIHKEGTIPKNFSELTELQKEIREDFDYDLEKGKLFYKDTKVVASYKSNTPNSYCALRWKGVQWLEHKLIMLYMLGDTFDLYEVDHIDHDRTNNKWNNLRVVCRKANARNLSKPKSNTSGQTGVSWHKTKNKWRAHIMVDYKQLHLGLFSSFEDAVAARKEAEQKYKFHENHGK